MRDQWDIQNFAAPDTLFEELDKTNEGKSSTAVDNILRLNLTNIVQMSLMADTKANIMITVSSIVFSVTVANMVHEQVAVPLSILGFFSTIALLCAIAVIMPRTGYPKKPGSKEIDRSSPFFNPLFFGHFSYIPLEEFKKEYAQRLERDSRTYDAIVGDIYGLGRVLATNKFKWLRYSFQSFLCGIIGAITSYIFLDVIKSLYVTIQGEWAFTVMGFNELLCMLSNRC